MRSNFHPLNRSREERTANGSSDGFRVWAWIIGAIVLTVLLWIAWGVLAG